MDAIQATLFNDYEYIFRIFLALLFGGLIGLEREIHGRPAGLRTNILVCLGSAAVVVAFERLYLTTHPGVESAIRMDPARAAAGIITGIGFLGAGTIIKSEEFVRGLTTAASIWVVSAIGITLGLGEYTIAILVTALVLFTLFVLSKFRVKPTRYAEIGLEGKGDVHLFGRITTELAKQEVTVKDYSLSTMPGKGAVQVNIIVSYKDRDIGPGVLDALAGVEGIERLTWK